LLVLASLSALGGCDVSGFSDDPSLVPPAVQVLSVEVATAVDAGGLPDGYTPLDGRGSVTNALTTSSIKVRFDRFLRPADTFRQSICVQSSLARVTTLAECRRPVFLEPAYDPVHREIIYRQSPDPGETHLLAGATYQITLFPAYGEVPGGVRAFDGATLDEAKVYTFSTVPAPEGARVDEPPRADVFCSAVQPALRACAYAGCHLDIAPKGGAAEGLDLSAPERIAATAVGRVAHETETGAHANSPTKSAPRFGASMPLLDPTFPANSYLVYKLLASEASASALPDAASAAEIARLRDGVVVGMPMPPTDAPGAAVRDPATLDAIVTWLFEGAPTPACP
jgi:hypothetical protein